MDLINYIVGGLGILGGLIGAVCTMVLPVLIFGALGFYLYRRNQKSTEYRKAAQSWPSTTGLVITSTIQSKRTGRSVSEYPVIIYQYSVNGRDYQASTIKTGEQFLKVGGSIISSATVKRYPVGTTVTVFYNPENPGEAALEDNPAQKPPLILIVGPTAVGKTELAIRIAKKLNGEIISADSRLFYRGMDIGTAKPAKAEMDAVPHHLIDIVEPSETLSLTRFRELAAQIVCEIHKRGKLPFLVGGTGQYVRAITQDWEPPGVSPNEKLREILENLARANSPEWLHAKLFFLDPAAADKIDARNIRRTVRALEVILSSGRKFSAQRAKGESSYHLITIGLIRPRPELYQRIDQRIEAMFANGLLDEVKNLLQKGFSPALPSMSAIGYRECVRVLQGEMDIEQAQSEMRRITRVFVRRQGNWFKEADSQIRWFNPSAENAEEEITLHIRNSLAMQVL